MLSHPSLLPASGRLCPYCARQRENSSSCCRESPKALTDPENYYVRANIMWCATNALNDWLSLGVPTDWASHMIGHELTALYGTDHGTTLAIVVPGVWEHQRERKQGKLLQYAERVWDICEGNDDERVGMAIEKTDSFFQSLGIGTRLKDHSIPNEACELVAKRLADRGMRIGEHADLGEKEVAEILRLRL